MCVHRRPRSSTTSAMLVRRQAQGIRAHGAHRPARVGRPSPTRGGRSSPECGTRAAVASRSGGRSAAGPPWRRGVPGIDRHAAGLPTVGGDSEEGVRGAEQDEPVARMPGCQLAGRVGVVVEEEVVDGMLRGPAAPGLPGAIQGSTRCRCGALPVAPGDLVELGERGVTRHVAGPCRRSRRRARPARRHPPVRARPAAGAAR